MLCVFFRKCHIVTLIMTLTYISLFRIIYSKEISGKYFEITLLLMLYMAKMTGVAVDIHFTHKHEDMKKKDVKSNSGDYEHNYDTKPTFWDLFHFTFFHIELVSGKITYFIYYSLCFKIINSILFYCRIVL